MLTVVLESPIAYLQLPSSRCVNQAIQFAIAPEPQEMDEPITCDLADILALRKAMNEATTQCSELLSFSGSSYYYVLSPVSNKHER